MKITKESKVDHWAFAQQNHFIAQIFELEEQSDIASLYENFAKSILKEGKTLYGGMPSFLHCNVHDFFNHMLIRFYWETYIDGSDVRLMKELKDYEFSQSVHTPFGEEFPA